MLGNTFPVNKVTQILSEPDKYRLIEVLDDDIDVLKTKFDNPLVGDEIDVVILDVETDGVDVKDCDIIELGMLHVRYSPSQNQFMQVVREASYLEQPATPITEEITNITGITNEMLEGHHFDQAAIMDWFDCDPIVIAHNAKFDRAFFEKRFNIKLLRELRWACSIKDINWYDFNYGTQRLEYLLLANGYVYNAHRALGDCKATLILLSMEPEPLQKLMRNALSSSYTIRAVRAPFECKDMLKSNDYEWAPESQYGKHWAKSVGADEYQEEWMNLLGIYHCENVAVVEETTARERYKK